MQLTYLQILESQRPTSRNFSAYLDTKKYPNNNASKRSKDKDWAKDKDKGRKSNSSHYNYKLKNNKERVANEEAPLPPPAPSVGQPREANGGDGDADFPTKFPSPASSLEDQEDSANFGSQSFSHQKLKNMHEQQNQQKEHPRDPKESREQDPSSPQLFDSIEILNERKFNKPIGAEQVGTGETAIGDIEDTLDNDEESDQHQQQQQEQEQDQDELEDEEEGIKSSIDNDELAKRYYPPTTTTEPTTLATTTSTTSTTTARTSTTTSTTAPRTTTTLRTSRTPQQQPTIGRKLKRHGSAFGPKKPQSPENRYYEIARIKQQQQQQQNQQEDTANVGELHYYDSWSNYNQKLATYDPEKSEENYLSGQHPRRNATDRRGATSTRFLDDEYSEPQPPPEEQRQWASPAEKPEKRDENPEGSGVGKLESDLDSGPQRYHSGKSKEAAENEYKNKYKIVK